MQAGHYSSLLPEVFRHKTTLVRLFQPQAILLDFHGTMSERRWEDKVVFPYVKKAITSYLRDNWNNDAVQNCIPGLRNESFEQRFRHKYEDAPVIDDQGFEDIDPILLVNQMSDFVLWQMNTKRETRETQTIERFVWQDGFRRRQISTPLYDDVMSCVKIWREQYGCSIYVISSIDGETLKLLFENTDKGNLHQYISGYISAKKTGDKLINDIYKQFYEKLPLPKVRNEESKLLRPSTKQTFNTKSATQNGSKTSLSSTSLSSLTKTSSSSTSLKVIKSPPISSLTSDYAAKPVLFLTDSGQEAKAASQVADGAAFECLLVNRPGNKRIRTYYLSQFQYVDKFTDIVFVQQNQQ